GGGSEVGGASAREHTTLRTCHQTARPPTAVNNQDTVRLSRPQSPERALIVQAGCRASRTSRPAGTPHHHRTAGTPHHRRPAANASAETRKETRNRPPTIAA